MTTLINFREIAQSISIFADVLGVLIIAVGLVSASVKYLSGGRKAQNGYKRYRQDLGHGILLGLEFLVAADIIRTVAVTPTLQGVFVLGIIVLIRTFLSMALEIEVEGCWPWRARG